MDQILPFFNLYAVPSFRLRILKTWIFFDDTVVFEEGSLAKCWHSLKWNKNQNLSSVKSQFLIEWS